jgi:hypothetical protein
MRLPNASLLQSTIGPAVASVDLAAVIALAAEDLAVFAAAGGDDN